MGEPERWQQGVEEFVLEQVGDPPTRVLEVGCGEGRLARALARAGHFVTAIDPRAPEGPIFRRVKLEEFSESGPFDYVVASLSLHHIKDLGSALDKIANLLQAGGALIVVEFAWDRFDEATAAWVLERLPAVASSSEDLSWLQRCCQGLVRASRGEARVPAEAYFSERASKEGFHSSRRLLNEFDLRFVERHFTWVPYLYPDLDEDTSEADESAAIEAGAINATGFRYVGIDALNAELVGVVRETMQPAHVSLWLRPDTPTKGEQAE
jgi:SAM-dependent methyltransferase